MYRPALRCIHRSQRPLVAATHLAVIGPITASPTPARAYTRKSKSKLAHNTDTRPLSSASSSSSSSASNDNDDVDEATDDLGPRRSNVSPVLKSARDAVLRGEIPQQFGAARRLMQRTETDLDEDEDDVDDDYALDDDGGSENEDVDEAEIAKERTAKLHEFLSSRNVRPGDEPFVSDDATQLSDVRSTNDAALVETRYRIRKRPNRKAFNPLPGVLEEDDAHDVPPETVIASEIFEELEEDDQLKLRAHQGLIRLRRNEQKLQRLLSMKKASKQDLLMLLNELDSVNHRETPLYEKYIGPKLTIDQMEDDIEYLWSWAAREVSDEPVAIGDSALERKIGIAEDSEANDDDAPAEDKEEDSETGENSKRKEINAPKINSAGLSADAEFWYAQQQEQIKYQNELTERELNEQELEHQHDTIGQLREKLGKLNEAVRQQRIQLSLSRAALGVTSNDSHSGSGDSLDASLHGYHPDTLAMRRASRLRMDVEADTDAELRQQFPQLYIENYVDDEFTESEFSVSEAELAALMGDNSIPDEFIDPNAKIVDVNNAIIHRLENAIKQQQSVLTSLLDNQIDAGTAAVGTQSSKTSVEEHVLSAADAKELAADKDVSSLLGSSNPADIQAMFDGSDAARPGWRQSTSQRQHHAQSVAVVRQLEQESSLWRIKQKIVAQTRALYKESGLELDSKVIDAFMADDHDTSIESILRDAEEVDTTDRKEFAYEIRLAEQRIAKQKAWLKALRTKIGDDTVRQLIACGRLQLDTFKSLNDEILSVIHHSLHVSAIDSAVLKTELEDQLENFNAVMAKELGVDESLIAQALDGQPVEFPKSESTADFSQPAVVDAKEAREMLIRLVNEDLESTAQALEAKGDALGAKKLRLMHARQQQYLQSLDSDTTSEVAPVPANIAAIAAKGSVLHEDPTLAQSRLPLVQRAKYGTVSAEESTVNKALIERGDGSNELFEDRDFNIVDLSPPSELGLPSQLDRDGVPLPPTMLQFELADPQQVAANYNAKSAEERAVVDAKLDAEMKAENIEFDLFIASQLPTRYQQALTKQWKAMTEEQRAEVIAKARYNREEFQHWIDDKIAYNSELGQGIDELEQYHIDQPDPKIYTAIEGAFWHVGRWGLDERTPQQKLEGLKKKIVKRHAPETPDTQVLLDRIEHEMFAVETKDVEDHKDAQASENSMEMDEDETDPARFRDDDIDEGELIDPSKPFDSYNPFEDDPDLDDREAEVYADLHEQRMEELIDASRTERADQDESREFDPNREGVDDEQEPENPSDYYFSPRLNALEEARDARRAKYQDHDPMPSGDQRAFDDYYYHFDEEDHKLAKVMDPMDLGSYTEPMTQETRLNVYTDTLEKGQQVLSWNTREALWLLHKADPAVWTPSALAMKFRISHAHVSGILHMQAALERMKAHGAMDETNESLMNDAERRATAISGIQELLATIKTRDSLIARGFQGELLEVMNNSESDDQVIEEDMLHLLPQLKAPRVPDVRFVTENEMGAIIEEEKDVEQRFLSQQQRRAERESEHYRANGPIGSTTAPRYTRKADPDDNYQQPQVLDAGNLTAPINAHLVMTDITEVKHSRYSMVVRDVTGWLRQPTPLEFAAMRRKELQKQARFVYTAYQHERLTPS